MKQKSVFKKKKAWIQNAQCTFIQNKSHNTNTKKKKEFKRYNLLCYLICKSLLKSCEESSDLGMSISSIKIPLFDVVENLQELFYNTVFCQPLSIFFMLTITCFSNSSLSPLHKHSNFDLIAFSLSLKYNWRY